MPQHKLFFFMVRGKSVQKGDDDDDDDVRTPKNP